MFFIGIFGIEPKNKTIKEFNNTICPTCDRLTKAELVQTYTCFHFFFLPLFKWNFKYYIRFICCNSIYEVDEGYVDELKNSDTIDVNRLKKMSFNKNICPECGNYVNPDFSYCPHCGRKQ